MNSSVLNSIYLLPMIFYLMWRRVFIPYFDARNIDGVDSGSSLKSSQQLKNKEIGKLKRWLFKVCQMAERIIRIFYSDRYLQ